jgi:lipopolysaccharide/colanic/teichoic acid biosynthesis glycosyltransferase
MQHQLAASSSHQEDPMSRTAAAHQIDIGRAIESAQVWSQSSGMVELLPIDPYSDGSLKRSLDVLGASVLLLIAAPLMALIALAVRLDSPGPILYRQQRVGQNRRRAARPARVAGMRVHTPRRLERRRQTGAGRPFEILKFRTMDVDAERGGPSWSPPGDERVTRLGRLLRATHLDELPQLWNVLRGDMSLVGPRPERPCFVGRFVHLVPGYRRRFVVRPGITGLAQLQNGYDRSLADVHRKLRLDLEYLQRADLLIDLWLLLRTLPHLLHICSARPRRR